MANNKSRRPKIDGKVVLAVLVTLAPWQNAQSINVPSMKSEPVAIKTLHFPDAPCTGNLFLIPETGSTLDPKGVNVSRDWSYFAAAQGDVAVPLDRDVCLHVLLAPSEADAERLRQQHPSLHQVSLAERVRRDPEDLSGLRNLEPNDLFGLVIESVVSPRGRSQGGKLEPLAHLTGLKMLSLSRIGITDKDLESLKPLHQLRALELWQEPFLTTRNSMAALRALPALEYIDLPEGLTDIGLKEVANISSLRYLRVQMGGIWGAGLASLGKLPHLERLCLWGIKPISDRHIAQLEGLAQLKSLTIWGVGDSLTDASLVSIGKLTSLEELYFIRTAPKFTRAGPAHLLPLQRLRKIDFGRTMWNFPSRDHDHADGDDVIQHLVKFPHLESIAGQGRLSAKGMKTLASLRNLKELSLSLHVTENHSSPTGMIHLSELKLLESLHIVDGPGLSDADWMALQSLPRLRELFYAPYAAEKNMVPSIAKLSQLQSLYLSVPGLTRTELNSLNTLTNLRRLTVDARTRSTSSDITYVPDEMMLDLSGLQRLKEIDLSGISLSESDLHFLKDMRLLENVDIHPVEDSLAGGLLRYLRDLPELSHLHITGLLACTAEDLASFNQHPKLRRLMLSGNIDAEALSSLTGLNSLESLQIETPQPIPEKTVTELIENHHLEYLRIRESRNQSMSQKSKVPIRIVPPRRRQPNTGRR